MNAICRRDHSLPDSDLDLLALAVLCICIYVAAALGLKAQALALPEFLSVRIIPNDLAVLPPCTGPACTEIPYYLCHLS